MVNKEYEDYWGDDTDDSEEVPIEEDGIVTEQDLKKQAKIEELEMKKAEEEEAEEEAEEEEAEEEAEEEEAPVRKVMMKRPVAKPAPVKPTVAPKPVQPKRKDILEGVKISHQPAQQEMLFLEVDGEKISFEELPVRTFLEVRAIRKLLEK